MLGAEDRDEAEAIVTAVCAAALSPTARSLVTDRADFLRRIVEQVAQAADAASDRRGRKLSLHDADAPGGVVEVAALAAGAPLSVSVPVDPGVAEAWHADRARIEATIRGLDPYIQELVTLRFVHGMGVDETARAMNKGRAFVHQRERMLRREISRALREDGRSIGDAEIDALVSNQPNIPPKITCERIIERVFRRIFIEEPPSYGRRATLAFASLAVGVAAWGAMFGGAIPGPASDRFVEPSVELVCEGPCSTGASASVRVAAPKDARSVAVFVEKANRRFPIAVDPAGGSIALPIGAKTRPSLIPYPMSLADTATTGTLVAVFAREDLSARELASAMTSAMTSAAPAGTSLVRASLRGR